MQLIKENIAINKKFPLIFPLLYTHTHENYINDTSEMISKWEK